MGETPQDEHVARAQNWDVQLGKNASPKHHIHLFMPRTAETWRGKGAAPS
jgi:hypothetical protein